MSLYGNVIVNSPNVIIASNGAEVLTGARGDIHDNLITGNECDVPLVCGSDPVKNDQASGILSFLADPGTSVRHNVVSSNDIGIYTDDGIVVADNNASGNRYESIYVDTDAKGAIVRGNTTNDGNYGIYVNKATGNTFEFDSSHRNKTFDMYSDFAANTFHANSCDTAFPSKQVWDCTQPECQEADGDGRFHGQQDGDFSADNDGCKDGTPDGVSSTNRGDGKPFQSTRINSLKFDSIAHSLTVTGVGMVGAVPVTFVLLEIETGPLTPGWVSLTFSDGYTNGGPLLSGSISLH
jgi:hypothetical protein